jgi:hypothetical protein
VDTVADEFVGTLEELSGENDNGGGSITDLSVLDLGEFAEDLGGGVSDLNLLKNGGAIIGDHDIADFIDKHLVETLGTEGSFNDVSEGGDSLD